MSSRCPSASAKVRRPLATRDTSGQWWNASPNAARAFRVADEAPFVTWLSSRVTASNSQSVALKATAYDHLRAQRIEPPLAGRCHRLLAAAVRLRERGLVKDTAAQMSLPLSISSLPRAL